MLKYKQAVLMNVLTFFILLLNNRGFAISTLAPPFCCSRVTTYYYRPVIRVKSCFSWVEGACNTGVADCSIGCCCCCWDMLGGSDSDDNGSDDDSLYEDEQSSLSEFMASY